jgi:spore germination protein YaaH
MRFPRLVVTLLAAAGALGAQAPAPRPTLGGERLFYYVDGEASWRSLVANADRIDIVGPQSLTVDSLGIVYGTVDPLLTRLAREKRIRVMPLVVNEGFQQAPLHRLLADTVAQRRGIRSLVALCRQHDWWGIQFDLENISITDRDRFTAFYRRTADALHAEGRTLSVAVVASPGEEVVANGYHRFMLDSWRGAFDLAALAEAGDFISIMTYDQHTRRTPPGPVAGVPWMQAMVEHALRLVPPGKLSLGIPLYGRWWYVQGDASSALRTSVGQRPVSWTWGTHVVERAGGAVQWDASEGTSWARITVGGTWEWLFLEDVRAFDAKLAVLRARRLRGFSAWELGSEDPAIWPRLPTR